MSANKANVTLLTKDEAAEAHYYDLKVPILDKMTPEKPRSNTSLLKKLCACCSCFTCCCSICCFVIILIAAISWGFLGSFIYDFAFLVDTSTNTLCPFFARNNTPSEFYPYTACDLLIKIPLNQYWVPRQNWSEVTFPPRDLLENWPPNSVSNLSAIFYNTGNSSAPFIISMNGYKGCNRDPFSVLPASMLWRAGYNVLSINLRNHGKSAVNARNPYASFGHVEHLDVLSALDYLGRQYPHLTHSTAQIGLFGPSMGGATTLIAMSKDERFRAAFVESPACDVYRTLESNAVDSNGPIGSFLLKVACSISYYKSSNKCPTFPNNPVESVRNLKPTQAVFFQHTKADLIVPFFNSETCVAAAKETGATVLTYFVDRVTPPETIKQGKCDNHCQLMYADAAGFEKRLQDFFYTYLPIKKI